MNINYRFDDKVTPDELFKLLDRMIAYNGDRFPAQNVFHVPLRDRRKEQTSLDNTVSLTARNENGDLVGFARLLTDHVYMFYLLDVMVEPAVRGAGIGRNLVRMAVDYSKDKGFIKIFLTAIPGTEEFYAGLGFKPGMSPVLTIRGEDYV